MSLLAIIFYIGLIGLGCAALYWLFDIAKLPANIRVILIIIAAACALVWLAGKAGVTL